MVGKREQRQKFLEGKATGSIVYGVPSMESGAASYGDLLRCMGDATRGRRGSWQGRAARINLPGWGRGKLRSHDTASGRKDESGGRPRSPVVRDRRTRALFIF